MVGPGPGVVCGQLSPASTSGEPSSFQHQGPKLQHQILSESVPLDLAPLESRLFLLLGLKKAPVFAQGKIPALQVAPHLEQEVVKVVIRFLLFIVLS